MTLTADLEVANEEPGTASEGQRGNGARPGKKIEGALSDRTIKRCCRAFLGRGWRRATTERTKGRLPSREGARGWMAEESSAAFPAQGCCS
jgi:hypothetical protein